jgi:hypothetical protein
MAARRAREAYVDVTRPRTSEPGIGLIRPAGAYNKSDMVAQRAELKAAEDAAERAYRECVERGWASPYGTSRLGCRRRRGIGGSGNGRVDR